MKKVFAIALCAAMALSMTACSSDDDAEETVSSTGESGTIQTEGAESSEDIAPAGTSEVVNPYLDCRTLEEAQELAGLTWDVPEEIGGSTERLFRAVEDEMLEVTYKTEDAETARIRKAPGSDDISGVNEDFTTTETVEVGDSQVTMKGDGELLTVAVWSDDENAYSVALENGMSRDDLSSLVLSLQEKETV